MSCQPEVSPWVCAESRCSVCVGECTLVEPTGPTSANILLIGEKPGQNEDKAGRVFVGDTGKELDRLYLPLAGYERDDVRVVNSVRCRLGGSNNKPTPAQVEACARYWLPYEVAMTDPLVIVLMGSTACSLVPSLELDKQHGVPVWIEATDHGGLLGEYAGWVWPCYHPAAGLHESSKMTHLMDDFRRLRDWMVGLWNPPNSDVATDYRRVTTVEEIDADFDACQYYHVPMDTESDGPSAWSVQYSIRPGHGRLILAGDTHLLWRLDQQLEGHGLLLHHAVHDLGDLERMGIRIDRPIRDTMQEAYHLGNLPQGLKALAYRLLGVKMKSWEDTVMPTSRIKMLGWLASKWLEQNENKIMVEIQLKTKVKYVFKPTEQERDLKRILGHASKPTYDIWAKAGEAGFTGYPIPSIAHAPLGEAVDYACRDADVTGRLGSLLEQERGRIVNEEWDVPIEDEDL